MQNAKSGTPLNTTIYLPMIFPKNASYFPMQKISGEG